MRAAQPESLGRTPALLTSALRAAVEPIAMPVRTVVAYHLGWIDRDGRPHAGDGGKSLRAALALLSAEAAGADERAGVPAAVAVQMVHEFSLLHDDLMDGDETRRHRPTAWTVFGPGLAILAGDALLSRAVEVLLQADGHGCEAAEALSAATQELIAGQAADLLLERRLDVTIDECLRMAGAKTGALISCACVLGARLVGGSAQLTDGLARYGEAVGLGFQLVDDLLGIWGDPQVTGKPVHADLRAQKRSVPVVAALTAGGRSAARLTSLLADGDLADEEEIALAVKLIEDTGAREWTAAEARRQGELAAAALADLSLPPVLHDELLDIANYVVARDL